jgi:integrase
MPVVKMLARTIDQRTPPPASGQVDYWDESLPGFGIRVSAAGRKTWTVLYRLPGNPRKRRMTIGTSPPVSLAEARAKAKDVQHAASKGVDLGAEKKAARKAETFRDLATLYLERWAKRHKKSWKKDEAITNRDLNPSLGAYKVQEITRADINGVLERIIDRGAPIQANRTFEILRKMFSWAVSQDFIESSPCYGISKPTPEHSRDRVLSETEIRKLWAALDHTIKTKVGVERKASAKRTLIALKLILVTAQRPGEITGAPWSEFDPGWETTDHPVWTIPATRTKNGVAQQVPLSPLAIRLFQEAKKLDKGSDWVFPSPRGDQPVTEGSLPHVVRSSGCFGLPDWRPHDLRRTAASSLTGEHCGVPRFIVAKILNHKSRDVTGVYDLYEYGKEKREALELWGRRLADIVGGENAIEK